MKNMPILVFLMCICLCGCNQEASSEQSETADIESSEYDIPFVDVDESEPASESSINDNDVLATENQEALSAANKYLNNYCISKQKLVNYLKQRGFSEEASCFAVDNCGADWNEQALKKAKGYLKVMPFSYKTMVEYIESKDGFTHEEAVYASDNCGADWNEQALLTAKKHLVLKRTRNQLINFLKELGFTDLQAEYAADNYR